MHAWHCPRGPRLRFALRTHRCHHYAASVKSVVRCKALGRLKLAGHAVVMSRSVQVAEAPKCIASSSLQSLEMLDYGDMRASRLVVTSQPKSADATLLKPSRTVSVPSVLPATCDVQSSQDDGTNIPAADLQELEFVYYNEGVTTAAATVVPAPCRSVAGDILV